jgi:hypothetical protein
MKSFFTFLLLSGILIYTESEARQFRVGQIPNGGVFKCANCHVNPQGGGSRNIFGQKVESQFLDNNGNVKWGPELAAIDSDNDGFTNGQELGDPNGTWKIGDPAPGSTANVSKQWDASSKPPATVVEAIEYINRIVTYPNPSTNSVNIRFSLVASMPVRFDLYNTLGELVFSSPDFYMNEGENNIMWDTINNNGSLVTSGDYIMAIRTGNSVKSGIISVIR